MTFDDILAQIIDLLTRQGRVSYSALKRRFDLNDDYLNDLKDELLYVHPVQDDEGRGLVWTGNVAGTTETPAPPPQTISAPVTQSTRPTKITVRIPITTTSKGERAAKNYVPTFADAGWFGLFWCAPLGEPYGWTRPHDSTLPRQPEAVMNRVSLARIAAPSQVRVLPP